MQRHAAPAPPVLTEVACSATLLVAAFLFLRWWQRDAAYTRLQQERDEYHQTTRHAPPPHPRLPAAQKGRKRTALPQQSSASHVSPLSESAPVPLQARPGDRRARKERLEALAAQLIALVDQTERDSRHKLQSMDTLVHPLPSFLLSGAPDSLANDSSLDTNATAPGSFERTVSGASRYTAHLIKRRASSEAVSPVARCRTAPDLLASDSSLDTDARASPVGRSGSSPVGRTGSFERTVSGASRYTAHLIKRRASSE